MPCHERMRHRSPSHRATEKHSRRTNAHSLHASMAPVAKAWARAPRGPMRISPSPSEKIFMANRVIPPSSKARVQRPEAAAPAPSGPRAAHRARQAMCGSGGVGEYFQNRSGMFVPVGKFLSIPQRFVAIKRGA